MADNLDKIYKLVKLFKTESGEPLEITPGQKQIFETIILRKPKRNWVSCITQYGKSLICSLALILRAETFPEKWTIIGATEKKTRIIMNYVIGHLFDNPLFSSQLELDADSSYDRLRRERSKNRLTFKRGGEIQMLSAQATNSRAVINAVIGFGSQNIIIDDSSLLPDPLHSMIKRMLGGHKDNFLMDIGNPFRRNHFLRSYRDPKYNKIKIAYKQAIKEGRVTPEFIDEMRKEAFFDVLYECNFPDADSVDEKGWSFLFADSFLEEAMNRQVTPKGKKRMGVDIGGGGCYNAYVIRTDNYAYLKHKNRNPDTMLEVGRIQEIAKEEHILPQDIFVDDTGIGHGVSDRLHELEFYVNRIINGEAAEESERFINTRVEIYWEAKEWLKNGGALENNSDFLQLLDIKFKVDSGRRVKLMSKEDMRKLGIESPDVADAFSLTFAPQAIFDIKEIENDINDSPDAVSTGADWDQIEAQ